MGGRKVCKGLSTDDKITAERYEKEMNALLSRTDLHSVTGRQAAARLFNSRVVEIFYDDCLPSTIRIKIPWAPLNPSQFHYLPCPICGTFQYSVIKSLVINFSEFFIVICSQCGMKWRNPIPDEEFLVDLYGPRYFEGRYDGILNKQVGIGDSTDQDKQMRIMRTEEELSRWIDLAASDPQYACLSPRDSYEKPRRFLEIGGGRGYLQAAAQSRGFSTIGLEISPLGIRAAIEKNLLVFPIQLDEFCGKYLEYAGFFDVVAFFDFLEHVPSPRSVLTMVRQIMKDDGIAIFRVPCIELEETPKWHLADHIWHFSDETIRRLLDKEGFAILDEPRKSGRFPGEDGQVQNMTYFVRKV
jgi:SAM-dependent methyltransferase